jgi:hypothetical protein
MPRVITTTEADQAVERIIARRQDHDDEDCHRLPASETRDWLGIIREDHRRRVAVPMRRSRQARVRRPVLP